MEKKKKGLIALVLLLVVAIGVGFAAASTDSVSITGSAKAVAGDFDIQFKTDSTITYDKSATTGLTVSGAYSSVDVATMTVEGLKNLNDYAEATYTIKNASTDVAASIAASVSANVSDTTHYSVTATMASGANNVAAGGTTTVTVRVTLIKAFSDSAAAGTVQNYTITCTGTAIE